jgi:uncharacterized membrane protein
VSDLLVFAYDNETGAGEAIQCVLELQKQQYIALADAATVIRKPDGKVKVKQANNLVGAGALGGAFWGMLFGLLFAVPWLGLAIGALSGALGGKLTDVGIDDKFIKEVGATIEPGNSALFLMVTQMTEDKVMAELAATGAKLLRTNLSAEDEAKLRAAFGADEAAEQAV